MIDDGWKDIQLVTYCNLSIHIPQRLFWLKYWDWQTHLPRSHVTNWPWHSWFWRHNPPIGICPTTLTQTPMLTWLLYACYQRTIVPLVRIKIIIIMVSVTALISYAYCHFSSVTPLSWNNNTLQSSFIKSCSGDLPQLGPRCMNPEAQVQTRWDEHTEFVGRQWSLDSQRPPRDDCRTSHTTITTRFIQHKNCT